MRAATVYTRRRKGRGLWLKLLLLIATGVAGWQLYEHGPQLYLRLSGDSMLRIEERIGELQSTMLSGDSLESAHQIETNLRILQLLKKDSATSGKLYYLRGLLYFYEFLLRLPLESDEILELVSRGYLPLDRLPSGLPDRPIEDVALDTSREMRKALAYQTTLPEASTARLAIAWGELYYTARSDPALLDHIAKVERSELHPSLQPAYEWLHIALEILLGHYEKVAQQLEKSTLKLDATERKLLLAYAHLYGRNYLPSLNLAREIKACADLPLRYEIEALRLEGENFYHLRGVAAARFYFQQAIERSGGNDPFLEERLRQLENQ